MSAVWITIWSSLWGTELRSLSFQAFEYMRDLSRWLLLWVRGLMRTSLSFLSTPVSTDYFSVYLLGLFLGQLEIIVWIEKDAWQIGNFFLKNEPRKETEIFSSNLSSNTKAMICFGQWYHQMWGMKSLVKCLCLVTFPILLPLGTLWLQPLLVVSLPIRYVSEVIHLKNKQINTTLKNYKSANLEAFFYLFVFVEKIKLDRMNQNT